jgi:hypothetical protein
MFAMMYQLWEFSIQADGLALIAACLYRATRARDRKVAVLGGAPPVPVSLHRVKVPERCPPSPAAMCA